MRPETFYQFIAPAAARFFPAKFSSNEASALILAIGLQESQFKYRRQLIGSNRTWWQSLNGPAVSYFQFEKIGIKGVLEHRASAMRARVALGLFDYPYDVGVVHRALVHNDLLAAVFARLALYRLPEPLPGPDDAAEGWRQYLSAWNPGKPHPERWEENYKLAWSIVLA